MSKKWLLTIVVVIVVIGSIFIIFKRQTCSRIVSQGNILTQQQFEQYEQRETIYEVKEGDSLWSISKKFGVYPEDIAKLNNISINQILHIGDKLRIPSTLQITPQEVRVQTLPVQQGEVYQVKEGDSLWTIARNFGVKVEDIARVNNISITKTLQIGDRLIIPQGRRSQIVQSQPSNKDITAPKGLFYKVQRGDSLWTIAKKYGVSADSIARANNISPNKTLQIGDKLFIPGKGASIQVAKSITKTTLKVVREGVLVRKGPGTNYSPLFKLGKGTEVVSLGQQGDWQKVALSGGKVGWIRRDMLGLSLAKKIVTSQNRSASKSTASSPNKENSGEASVVKTALSYHGARYAYGGLSSRGFDCSGFVKYVYQKHGINLPHSAGAQFNYGKPLSKSELQPGDLVFFRTGRSRGINHVGIYIGNGKFIHASSARGRVRIDSLNEGYYKARYLGARRLK